MGGWHKAEIRAGNGPTKVTSDAYRRGWKRVFGNKIAEEEA